MNTTDRQSYIDAITKLLEKADPRKLRRSGCMPAG